MDQRRIPIWHRGVQDFVAAYAPTITIEPLIEAIQQDVLLLEQPLPSGKRLVLVRLSVKVPERQEVFMGSALFGDYLRKSFLRAVEESELGPITAVTNDLETAYFLLVTRMTVTELAQLLQSYVEAHLGELFLEDDDPDKGIHGDFARMLSIPKSDFEPFPVFAVPRFLLPELERRMRQALRDFIQRPFTRKRWVGKGKQEVGVSLDYRLIQSTMAFCYGRTSGGSGDSQSHNTFMARLATEYGVISIEELAAAYGLPSKGYSTLSASAPDAQRQTLKSAIDEAIKNLSFDEERLRALLNKILDHFAEDIDGKPDGSDDFEPGKPYLSSWFMPYIRSSHKAIKMDHTGHVQALLHRVSLGPQVLALATSDGGWACRTCGDQQAIVPEKNILLGVSVGKFYNQLPNQPQASIRRICARCALYSYLGTKLFGATTSGKFPVPKQDNVIFHYGRHSEAGIRTLGRQLETAIFLIKKVREERISASLAQQKQQEEAAQATREDQATLNRLLARLNADETGLSEEEMQRLESMLKLLGNAEGEGIGNILEHVAECQVIDLGVGEDRLVAFALPRMKDDLELAEKRFVRARLIVYALIGFLQEACGCHGPFFFRTLPRIGEHTVSDDTDRFYVEDHWISGREYRQRYRAAAAFAWRVTKGHGKEGLTNWLGLSEDLVAEPLETFAQILRDSPLQPGSDRNEARYKILSNAGGKTVFNHDLNVWEGWEYLRAFRSLHALWREKQEGGDRI